MRAAILSLGDELALGQNVDTNSAWLSGKLAEASILTIEHRTLPDDQSAIARAIAELSKRADVLVITGGLGPTADDLTREALADALQEELVVDEDALQRLTKRFASRGIAMPEMNRKQAMRPQRMRCLANPNGTAPGLAGQAGACKVYALPGPPREMQPIFLQDVLPDLRAAERSAEEQVILTGAVQSLGMGESHAAEKIAGMMERDRNPLVGTTVSDSIVFARVRVSGPRRFADMQLDQTLAQIEQAWFPYAFGREGDSLSAAVGALLEPRRETVVVVESCTGGWLGKSLVDRPGSSAYFLGGWITYSDQLKRECVHVPPELIEQCGAVSPQVAEAMAAGALRQSSADWAVAVTGIAGPDGGTTAKPVGLVYIAVAGKAWNRAQVRRFQFPGDRTIIRDRATKAALQLLRFAAMNVQEQLPMLWESRMSATEKVNST